MTLHGYNEIQAIETIRTMLQQQAERRRQYITETVEAYEIVEEILHSCNSDVFELGDSSIQLLDKLDRECMRFYE